MRDIFLSSIYGILTLIHLETVFSASLDLYFAVYPAARFHQLMGNWRKKVTLSCMLGLGVV